MNVELESRHMAWMGVDARADRGVRAREDSGTAVAVARISSRLVMPHSSIVVVIVVVAAAAGPELAADLAAH